MPPSLIGIRSKRPDGFLGIRLRRGAIVGGLSLGQIHPNGSPPEEDSDYGAHMTPLTGGGEFRVFALVLQSNKDNRRVGVSSFGFG